MKVTRANIQKIFGLSDDDTKTLLQVVQSAATPQAKLQSILDLGYDLPYVYGPVVCAHGRYILGCRDAYTPTFMSDGASVVIKTLEQLA